MQLTGSSELGESRISQCGGEEQGAQSCHSEPSADEEDLPGSLDRPHGSRRGRQIVHMYDRAHYGR